jgi:hypothetical protein
MNLAIGRIIRRNEWWLMVGQNWKCYSSCALIYIASVRRSNSGVIGLHRPYFAESLDRQEIERAAPILLQKVREYVQSMGIVDSFYEQMVNTAPSEIRLYRGDEITNLVPKIDPTYDEIQNSYDARKYGVSAAEMRQRKSIAEQKCTSGHWVQCQEALYWGLDVNTYREPLAKEPKCAISSEDYQAMQPADRKKQRDLPPVLKFEACVRNKMLGGLPNTSGR